MLVDLLLAAVLTFNAAAVGIAIGAYGDAGRDRDGGPPAGRVRRALTRRRRIHAGMQAAAQRPRARRGRDGDRAAARRRGRRSRPTSRSERRDESLAEGPAAHAGASSSCPRCSGSGSTSRRATGRTSRASTSWATSSPGRHARSPAASPRSSTPRSTPPPALLDALRLVAIGALLLTAAVDRRCARCTAAAGRASRPAWELRLGRDDLANPYRVQEMFEGIAGAIRARWYERLWRGCDHFALEVHWLPDLLDPLHRRRAHATSAPRSSGPLEDLYPDVELVEHRRRTHLGADASCGSRSGGPFVLSIQTTRNYEHAFTESLVALLSSHDHETTVQLVLTPAPGFVHRRARRLLKRRERALQHADKRDPGELGIDSVVEAKELKGALELQHRSLLYFDLRVDRAATATTARRVAGLFSQLRSENELGPRNICLRRRLYARRIAAGAAEPAARAAHRGALDLGAGDALAAASRARQARAAAARDRQARDRAAGDRARPRRGSCSATSAAPSRSRRRTASTGTR